MTGILSWQPNPTATGPRVAYFHGCAANYFDDGWGCRDRRLAETSVKPELHRNAVPGRRLETHGHVDLVKDNARFNLQSLAGIQVVTGCASCTLMPKEYKKFFEDGPERQAADALAKKVVHITEFVARRGGEHPPMGAAEGPRPSGDVPFILPPKRAAASPKNLVNCLSRCRVPTMSR